MRLILCLMTAFSLAACQDEGAVADDALAPPPIEVTQEIPGDWSALDPAVGRTLMGSGALEVGPIVIDVNAMLGEHAPKVRARLHARTGPLQRLDGLLIAYSEPGPKAAYLIADPEQRALEIGWLEDGIWQTERTAGSQLGRPAAIRALRGER